MQETIIKHRRGTTEEWAQFDLLIQEGEIVIEECSDGSKIIKIGDGEHKYSELPSFTERMIVKDLILKSPSGKKFIINIDNTGNLNTNEL